MTEEKRKESRKYKQKAIEVEQRLAQLKRRNKTFIKNNQSSSEMSSFAEMPPSRQSTPARPATLNLLPKTYILPSTEFEPVKDGPRSNIKDLYHQQNLSSQSSTKNIDRSIRSTLEQRLANEDNVIIKNKRNKFKQSPILEEHYPVISGDPADSDDSKKDRKRWSPLKLDSLSSLRIELPNKDPEETEENLETSMDDVQNTSDTITPSSSLLRQNSYTLLTPSPALLNYLESQRNNENAQRSHSGRKTWDLTKARKSWDPNSGKLCKSLDEGHVPDEIERRASSNYRHSSSLDGFSMGPREGNFNSTPRASPRKTFVDDGSTSPSSCNSKIYVKPKTRNKKVRPYKNVPSPQAIDNVPSNNGSDSMQGALKMSVPSEVKQELADLSNILLKMKLEHERQKKELEEKQRLEMKELEILFKRKETEILSIVNQSSKKYQKSIYSQYTNFSESLDFDARMSGDGNHIRSEPNSIQVIKGFPDHPFVREEYGVRPHSAKDIHPQYFNPRSKFDRRSRSVDFNQGNCNQDTDLDVSFQEDSLLSKGIFPF